MAMSCNVLNNYKCRKITRKWNLGDSLQKLFWVFPLLQVPAAPPPPSVLQSHLSAFSVACVSSWLMLYSRCRIAAFVG